MIMSIVWLVVGLVAVFFDGWIKSQNKTLTGYLATLKEDQRIIASAVATYLVACAGMYVADGQLNWSNVLVGVVCKDYLTTAIRQTSDPKKLK